MSQEQADTITATEYEPPPHDLVLNNAAEKVIDHLIDVGVWRPKDEGAVHRISPSPFVLRKNDIVFLESLGKAVLAFYKALNRLCLRDGNEWAKEWLNQGKPSWLLDFAAMNYSKQHLPRLLRPDLIFSEDGMWVTELDSVPGGAGLTAAMAHAYSDIGLPVVGGADGIPRAFAATIDELANKDTWNMAITVSDESRDYRAEMEYLASRLQDIGKNAWCVHPRDLLFDEEGLWLDNGDARAKIDIVWRFFELFDLKNIPKSELVMYAGKKKKVVVSPPYKPFLEEKLALGLLHHKALKDFWAAEMGEWFLFLQDVVPKTWIMDPRPVPAHAEIAGLEFRGQGVRDFRSLGEASQKERRLVVKPSGYSHLAWGARGVVVGHDVSREEWNVSLQEALDSFEHTPYILQEFHESKRVETDFFDPAALKSGRMFGRVRLSPYYYVVHDEAILAGLLATICPDDKKLIHGMADAVMTVGSLRE